MTKHLLDIKVKCTGNDKCRFDGQDMPIEINIINNQKSDIGFPLTYRQKTGPVIRLADTRTHAETYLKTNLADHDLQNEFTNIGPGKSVVIDWVITADEIQQFAILGSIDLSAEITIKAQIRANGMSVEFLGSDTVAIVGHVRLGY